MKKLSSLMVLMLLVQQVVAQAGGHLKLSDETPLAGEKITLTYDPGSTPLAGKKDISAAIFYLDNKDYPVADIELKADGSLLTGDFTIVNNCKAFFIRMSSGKVMDTNDSTGYVYMVYRDKQPVPGAYAAKGYLLSGAYTWAGLKIDMETSAGLYQKEFELYPESKKEYQIRYYGMLGRNLATRAILEQKITELASSDNEIEMAMAVALLQSQRKMKEAAVLQAAIKAKFPDGQVAKNDLRNTQSMAFNQEKDVIKKERIYQTYIKNYPENTNTRKTIEDYYRLVLAKGYLYNNDLVNFFKYESIVKDKSGLPVHMNVVASRLADDALRLRDAEKLSKRALDILTDEINHPEGFVNAPPSENKRNNQALYYVCADTYAGILYKLKKPTEALKYERDVYDHIHSATAPMNENYMLILAANGQYAEAQKIGERAIRGDMGSAVVRAELKKDYIKTKGSVAGFTTYLAGIENIAKDRAKEKIAKTMINLPAPNFMLKDLAGKTVSLASLKGKVVIIDFWATWCGHCLESFPGMQLAVNKYKNDPDVVFLFVDCLERNQNYMPAVKKLLAENKYHFHVLLDEPGADGLQSKVVSSYSMDGLPVKFIIDKAGNIRFKYVGYSGIPEALLAEIDNMIDLAKNPDSVAAPKTTSN